MSGFTRATKGAAKLRLALAGPAGSGKTYSALSIAAGLGAPVAVVDTEHGSASKYADLFDFDTMELDSFHPQKFIDAIDDAEKAHYAVLILDSLSHAWMGKDGTLDLVDKAAKRSQSGNSFSAWKDVTPIQNALIDRIVGADIHIIATLRVKTEYIIQTNEKGRQEPKKIGLAPVQRDQVEYEFDVYGDLDQSNNLIIGKTRCPALSGQVVSKPGAALAATLRDWLGTGAGTVAVPSQPTREQSPEPDEDDQAFTIESWNEVSAEADRLHIAHKQLPPTAPASQIEKWTVALMERINEANVDEDAAVPA